MIALHYHWSEADILGLPERKRRRYLELLARSLTPERPAEPRHE